MHPGQITFFECKSSSFGRYLLATSNGDLKEIFLWDVYGRGAPPGPVEDQSAHAPDMVLSVPKEYEVENMRWTGAGYQMYTTVKEASGAEDFMLCVYDVPDGSGGSTQHDESGRVSKVKKSAKSQFSPIQCVNLPLNISYLCLNEHNKNIIYGTNDTKKFSIDLRAPRSISLFADDTADTALVGKEDAMVEYNQNNYITFANRLQKSILIYDVRQVSSSAGQVHAVDRPGEQNQETGV